jgi:hypothetical protein
MWLRDLPVNDADAALRVVRALGKHRYVAGRMHMVHALAAHDLFEWAREVIDDDEIDKASRDERLVRRVSDEELHTVLAHYWSEETGAAACDGLLERLEAYGVEVVSGEDDEDDTFPLLVDAGWELLPLAELDAERHRGAIEAFGERIHFDVAKFEEQEHLPPVTHLQELPAIGASELIRGPDALSLWLSGNETYQDYVVRGVLRAAKIDLG